MKINTITINRSTVSITDQSTNSEVNKYGISIEEFSEMLSIIKMNNDYLKESLKDLKDIANVEDIGENKKTKIVDVLKSVGIEMASNLTTSGILEILKNIFI